jgi:hypothetical protein
VRKSRRVSPQLRQKAVRDSRRTKRIFGLKEDANRWYRCHHCDFIIDRQENPEAFGDMNAKAGNFNAYDQTDYTPEPSKQNPLTLVREARDVTLVQIDAAGDDAAVLQHPTLSFVGCPLCGCRSNRT